MKSREFFCMVLIGLGTLSTAQAGGLVLYENHTRCERALTAERMHLGGPIILDITGGEMGDLVGDTPSQKPEKKDPKPEPLPRLPEVVPQIIPVISDKAPAPKKSPQNSPQNSPMTPSHIPFHWPEIGKKNPKPSKPN